MHVYMEAILLYHSLPCFLETESLTQHGARLTASDQPAPAILLSPSPIVPGLWAHMAYLALYVSAEIQTKALMLGQQGSLLTELLKDTLINDSAKHCIKGPVNFHLIHLLI